MTYLNILRGAVVGASFMIAASGAQAQTATMDTPENIAAVMNACLVIVTTHDYDAEGQGVDIPWVQATERVSGFEPEGDPAKVSANVWSSDMSYNSFCDIFFDDADMAEPALDLFMEGREQVALEGSTGICVDDAFVQVEILADDISSAELLGAQDQITMHNTEIYGDNPCAE